MTMNCFARTAKSGIVLLLLGLAWFSVNTSGEEVGDWCMSIVIFKKLASNR